MEKTRNELLKLLMTPCKRGFTALQLLCYTPPFDGFDSLVTPFKNFSPEDFAKLVELAEKKIKDIEKPLLLSQFTETDLQEL